MASAEHILKTDFFVDLPRLTSEIEQVIDRAGFHPSTQQIGLTHTPDCPAEERFHQSTGSLYDYDQDRFIYDETDFSTFNVDLQGTYLHWLYQNLPFNVGRMRIMKMPPRKCLSVHDDTGPRYHIAIKTNPNSYLFFPKDQKVYQIPADGHLYSMNAVELHTAFNADLKEDRIHLVFS